jgi:hypothetical protein
MNKLIKPGPMFRKTFLTLGLALTLLLSTMSPSFALTTIQDVLDSITKKFNSLSAKLTTVQTAIIAKSELVETNVKTELSNVEGRVTDTISNVETKIDNRFDEFKGNLDTGLADVLGVLDEARVKGEEISTEELKAALDNVIGTVRDAIPTKQDLDAFENTGACGFFRDDLVSLNDAMFALSGEIAGSADARFATFVQDPGLSDLIGKMPCPVLYPAWDVMNRLGLDQQILVDSLEEAIDYLVLLRPLVETGINAATDQCGFIADYETEVNLGVKGLKGTGVAGTLLGKVFSAVSDTPAGGPSEAAVGAWGFAEVTVKTHIPSFLGKALAGLGELLKNTSEKISNKQSSCEQQSRHDLLMAGQFDLTGGQLGLREDHEALFEALTSQIVTMQANYDVLSASHVQLQTEMASISGLLNDVLAGQQAILDQTSALVGGKGGDDDDDDD